MLGNNIARYRKEQKMTQQELADSIRITRSALSKIENGVWMPSADTMKSISDRLHVPLGDIFFNPDVLNSNTIVAGESK